MVSVLTPHFANINLLSECLILVQDYRYEVCPWRVVALAKVVRFTNSYLYLQKSLNNGIRRLPNSTQPRNSGMGRPLQVLPFRWLTCACRDLLWSGARGVEDYFPDQVEVSADYLDALARQRVLFSVSNRLLTDETLLP